MFGLSRVSGQGFNICGDFHKNNDSTEAYLRDRFGNFYSKQDVNKNRKSNGSTPLALNTNTPCGNSGVFNLFFQDVVLGTGVGFDDHTASGIVGLSKGELARQTVCYSFKDVSDLLIQSTPVCDAKMSINIEVQPSIVHANYYSNGSSIGTMDASELGVSSAYYDSKYQGIKDGLPWIILNAGNANPFSSTFHGFIRINLVDFTASPWNLDYSTSTTVLGMDLRTIVTHEIFHILGVVSNFDDKGFPENNNNIITNPNRGGEFTRWDNNLFLDNLGGIQVKLIQPNPTPISYHFNDIITSQIDNGADLLLRGCPSTNQQIIFKGNSQTPINVFSGTTFKQKTSYMHLCDDTKLLFASIYQNNSKFISTVEKQILCDLGYSLSAPSGLLVNCSCSVAGHDGIYNAGCGDLSTDACTPIVISKSQMIGDDINVTDVQAAGLLIPLNATLVLNGNDYTFSSNTPGNYTIWYIPINSTCNKQGNLSYININVYPGRGCPSTCVPYTSYSPFQIAGCAFASPFYESTDLDYHKVPCNLVCNGQIAGSIYTNWGYKNTIDRHQHINYNFIGVQYVDVPNWTSNYNGDFVDFWEETSMPYTINNQFSPPLRSGSLQFNVNSSATTPVAFNQGDYLISFKSLNDMAGLNVSACDLAGVPTSSSNSYVGANIVNPFLLPLHTANISIWERHGTCFNIPSRDYNGLWFSFSPTGNNNNFMDEVELIPDDFSALPTTSMLYSCSSPTVSIGQKYCMLSGLEIQYTLTDITHNVLVASYKIKDGVLTVISGNVDPVTFEVKVSSANYINYKLTRTVTNLGGIDPDEFQLCGNTKYFNVINPNTLLTSQPVSPASICQNGSSSAIHVNLSNNGANTAFQWQYFNAGTWVNVVDGLPTGAIYTNATDNDLTIANITTPSIYQYRCKLSFPTTGCNDIITSPISVAIIQNPTIQITPLNPSICPGGSVTLTATGGAVGSNYSWSGGNSTQASQTYNNITTPTNYMVTVTGTNNCTATASRLVTLFPTPSASIYSSAPSICPGFSTTLTAFGGGSYAWSGGGNLPTKLVTPTTNTTYTVTVTGTNNCTATASQLITVNSIPTASVSFTGITVCSGNSVNLSASGGVSYQWSGGGAIYSNGQSYTPYPVNITSNNITVTYTVTVADANNCTATASSQITVQPVLQCCFGNPGGALVTLPVNATTASILPANRSNQQLYLPSSSLLTIDQSLTLTNCEMVCGANAKILVKQGQTLTITGSNLHGCAEMWAGIEVENGGTILVINNSTISDAMIGINFPFASSPNLTAKNSTFSKNKFGIVLNGGFGNYAGQQIDGCTFSFLAGDVMRPPLTGTIPRAGIFINNYLDWSITTANTFDGLLSGIVAYGANLTVANNTFKRIQHVGCDITYPKFHGVGSGQLAPECSLVYQGVGVYVDAGTSIPKWGSNPNLNLSNSTFLNSPASTGAMVVNAGTNISNNSFDTWSQGVKTNTAFGSIFNNTFTNVNNGIQVNQSSSPQRIFNNSIQLNNSGALASRFGVSNANVGIEANNALANIERNTISGGRTGIHVLAAYKGSSVYFNTINWQNHSTPFIWAQDGILIEQSKNGITVTDNNIQGNSPWYSESSGVFQIAQESAYRKRGISLNGSPNAQVSCNMLANIGYGLHFVGNNVTPSDRIKQNSFMNHRHALVLRQTGGIIGDVGTAIGDETFNNNNTFDGEYYNPYHNSRTLGGLFSDGYKAWNYLQPGYSSFPLQVYFDPALISSHINGIPHFGGSSVQFMEPLPRPTFSGVPIASQRRCMPVVSTILPWHHDIVGDGGPLTGKVALSATDEKVIAGDWTPSDYPVTSIYFQERELYARLLEKYDLLQDDSSLVDFVDEKQTESMILYKKVCKANFF